MSLNQSRVKKLVNNGRLLMVRKCALRKVSDAVSKIECDAAISQPNLSLW